MTMGGGDWKGRHAFYGKANFRTVCRIDKSEGGTNDSRDLPLSVEDSNQIEIRPIMPVQKLTR